MKANTSSATVIGFVSYEGLEGIFTVIVISFNYSISHPTLLLLLVGDPIYRDVNITACVAMSS